MLRKSKTPKESIVSMTELVLPNDTNTLNNLMGGRLMHWMDVVSAIAGQKHSNSTVVTASVDNISFRLRSEEHTSELQSLRHLVCRLLLEKKKDTTGLHSMEPL